MQHFIIVKISNIHKLTQENVTTSFIIDELLVKSREEPHDDNLSCFMHTTSITNNKTDTIKRCST